MSGPRNLDEALTNALASAKLLLAEHLTQDEIREAARDLAINILLIDTHLRQGALAPHRWRNRRPT